MIKLSRTDRTTILACLHHLARTVEHAADYGIHSSRLYRDLRKTIADHEKGHRRFAPGGWRHLFSVEQAVDYFVVRTVAEANPDATARDLANLREDYVKATFLMCDEDVRKRLAEYLAKDFPTSAAGASAAGTFRVMGSVDYSALSGVADRVDEETLNALAFARAWKAGA